jgi:hypothetical protein
MFARREIEEDLNQIATGADNAAKPRKGTISRR